MLHLEHRYARLSQTEISKLTGISTIRLSLAENHLLTLTPRDEWIRAAILKASKEWGMRHSKDADPRFQHAMRIIEGIRKPRSCSTLCVSPRGYSEMEAAVGRLKAKVKGEG